MCLAPVDELIKNKMQDAKSNNNMNIRMEASSYTTADWQTRLRFRKQIIYTFWFTIFY